MRGSWSLALLALVLTPPALAAQSLLGSRRTVEYVYRQALRNDLTFYRSGRAAKAAVARGKLVVLRSTANLRLVDVTYPYVLPTTRRFIERLAAQHRRACGVPLVVTSALRPKTFRLFNSVDLSVHPTGMALDLRKPRQAACRRWLRQTLLTLEELGLLDVTEEFHPPHFHVAVFPGAYRRYVGGGEGARLPTRGRAYRVRPGDTLWGLARRYGVSVAALRAANGLAHGRLTVGQTLRIPTDR